MEHKIEKESHSLGIIELDGFIKVITYLPNDIYYEIVVESQNYSNRFEYERKEISEFRNDIFDEESKGVFLFSNEKEYESFLLQNNLQYNTDEWFKIAYLKIGSDWFLKTKDDIISYIKRRSSNFEYKCTIKKQIRFCKDLIKVDTDFKIFSHHPNSVSYLDWAVEVVEIDDCFFYLGFNYTPRNYVCTPTFCKSYMNYLNNYVMSVKNGGSVLVVKKHQIYDAIKIIKNVFTIDLNNKVAEKSYWKARSFED